MKVQLKSQLDEVNVSPLSVCFHQIYLQKTRAIQFYQVKFIIPWQLAWHVWAEHSNHQLSCIKLSFRFDTKDWQGLVLASQVLYHEATSPTLHI